MKELENLINLLKIKGIKVLKVNANLGMIIVEKKNLEKASKLNNSINIDICCKY